jgi:DNA polymerase-3 subunit gamma/tau
MTILTEAEAGFKQAKNKKLHVEFHLIKLNYLKQAITLVSEDGIGKKKRIDEIKSVAFRQLTIREQKTIGEKTQAPKVEKTADEPVNHPSEKGNPINRENETNNRPPLNQPISNAQNEAPTGGLGALKKIRDQIQNRKQEKSIVFSLSDEKLNEAWNIYLEKLAANNQVTSHSNLKQAKLSIQDETNFEVKAESKIQQQFIEGERLGMTLHLQEFFNNNKIQYKVVLDVSAENTEIPAEQLMSRKDQYLKMVEMYPIIKNMRDQLNLDLDY